MIRREIVLKKAEELYVSVVRTHFGWTFYYDGQEYKFIRPYKNLKAYNFLLDIEKERGIERCQRK